MEYAVEGDERRPGEAGADAAAEEVHGVAARPGPAVVEIGGAQIRTTHTDQLLRIIMEGYANLIRILRVHLPNPFPHKAGMERGKKGEKCGVSADPGFINNILTNGDCPNRLADLCG